MSRAWCTDRVCLAHGRIVVGIVLVAGGGGRARCRGRGRGRAERAPNGLAVIPAHHRVAGVQPPAAAIADGLPRRCSPARSIETSRRGLPVPAHRSAAPARHPVVKGSAGGAICRHARDTPYLPIWNSHQGVSPLRSRHERPLAGVALRCGTEVSRWPCRNGVAVARTQRRRPTGRGGRRLARGWW